MSCSDIKWDTTATVARGAELEVEKILYGVEPTSSRLSHTKPKKFRVEFELWHI